MPKRKRFDWMTQKYVPIKPYTGILKSPACHPYDFHNRGMWLIKEFQPKIDALMDHYGIPRDADWKWEVLATQLALEHVPGLAPGDKGGRKAIPGRKEMDHALYLAVRDKTLNKKTKVTDAIRWLIKKDLRFKGMNHHRLRERYYSAKGKAENS